MASAASPSRDQLTPHPPEAHGIKDDRPQINAAHPAGGADGPRSDHNASPLRFHHRIHAAIEDHKALKARILAECGEEDEETLQDTLEGATRLDEILSGLLRSRDEDLALADGLRAHIQRCKTRLARIEARGETKRRLIRNIMIEASLSKIDLPDCTLSLRRSEGRVEIENEEVIPAAFWRPQPPKLDRANLQRALKRGAAIAGARLAPAQTTLVILSG